MLLLGHRGLEMQGDDEDFLSGGTKEGGGGRHTSFNSLGGPQSDPSSHGGQRGCKHFPGDRTGMDPGDPWWQVLRKGYKDPPHSQGGGRGTPLVKAPRFGSALGCSRVPSYPTPSSAPCPGEGDAGLSPSHPPTRPASPGVTASAKGHGSGGDTSPLLFVFPLLRK